MLVGEVRRATMSVGSVCRLSGGRCRSSGPTQRSNKRQLARAIASKLTLSDVVNLFCAVFCKGLLTHHRANGARAHTPQNSEDNRGCGVSVQSSAAHSANASTLAPACARSVARSPVCAAACAVAAVVHCNKCLRLTRMRHSARTIASLDDTALVTSWLKCHKPPPTTRATSINAFL